MAIIPVRDDAHWHELRAKHIGGSDISSLFGLSPYCSRWQLWMEKSGKLPPEDLSSNKAVMAGKFLEVGIAGWAASMWDMPMTKVSGYHTDDTTRGLGATLDYATEDDIPVEIKWSARGNGWEISGEDITSAPDNYILQCQHQIACFGGEYAWLVALIGNEPRRMKVPRNEDIIAAIRSEVAAFWDSIDADTPPEMDFAVDGDAIGRLMYNSPITDVTLPPDAAPVFERYLTERSTMKAAEEASDAAKAELLALAMAEMATRNTSQDKAVVRCGDHKMSISTVAENPGKVVTPEMVGTRIQPRKGYQTVRIS